MPFLTDFVMGLSKASENLPQAMETRYQRQQILEEKKRKRQEDKRREDAEGLRFSIQSADKLINETEEQIKYLGTLGDEGRAQVGPYATRLKDLKDQRQLLSEQLQNVLFLGSAQSAKPLTGMGRTPSLGGAGSFGVPQSPAPTGALPGAPTGTPGPLGQALAPTTPGVAPAPPAAPQAASAPSGDPLAIIQPGVTDDVSGVPTLGSAGIIEARLPIMPKDLEGPGPSSVQKRLEKESAGTSELPNLDTVIPDLEAGHEALFTKGERNLKEKRKRDLAQGLMYDRIAFDSATEQLDKTQSVPAAMEVYQRENPYATELDLAQIRQDLEARKSGSALDRFTDKEVDETVMALSNQPALQQVFWGKLPQRELRRFVQSHIRQDLVWKQVLTPAEKESLTDMDVGIWELAQLAGLVDDPRTASLFGPEARFTARLYGTRIYKDTNVLKARLAYVKQVVAKALEGGVLRKEDEAKYDAILAGITNDPEVARSKIGTVLLSLKYRRDRWLTYHDRGGGKNKAEEMTIEEYQRDVTRAPIDMNTATFEEAADMALAGYHELIPLIKEKYPDQWNKAMGGK